MMILFSFNLEIQMIFNTLMTAGMYAFAGLPLLNIKHLENIEDMTWIDINLHKIAYLIHGLIWLNTKDNLCFFLTLIPYFLFNMQYLFDPQYNFEDWTSKWLFVFLMVYSILLTLIYGSTLVIFSGLAQIIMIVKIISLHAMEE